MSVLRDTETLGCEVLLYPSLTGSLSVSGSTTGVLPSTVEYKYPITLFLVSNSALTLHWGTSPSVSIEQSLFGSFPGPVRSPLGTSVSDVVMSNRIPVLNPRTSTVGKKSRHFTESPKNSPNGETKHLILCDIYALGL